MEKEIISSYWKIKIGRYNNVSTTGLVAEKTDDIWAAYLKVFPGEGKVMPDQLVIDNGTRLTWREAKDIFPHLEIKDYVTYPKVSIFLKWATGWL